MTDEPIRVAGLAPGPDGQLRRVEVDVPPGPIADAVRDGTLRGISLDAPTVQAGAVEFAPADPPSTGIVGAGGWTAPLYVRDVFPPAEGMRVRDLFGQPRIEGPEPPPDPDDPPTPAQLQQPEAWERTVAELFPSGETPAPDTAAAIRQALADAYADGYRAGEWNS